MMCAQSSDHIHVSDHALERFRQRRVRLGLDDFDGNIMMLEAELRRIFAQSTKLDITKLRNWRERRRKYPDSTYFRNERFVLVMNFANNTLVTCFLFQGRRATRLKPRDRDERAHHKTVLRRHLHEGGEL